MKNNLFILQPVHLQFELKDAQTCTIAIFDVNGKLVYTENTDKIVKYENKLNLQSQAQGVYFLQIKTKQGNANLKLIKSWVINLLGTSEK